MRRVLQITILVLTVAVTAGCSSEKGLVAGRSDSSSIPEWQKDPGKLGERWRATVAGHLELTGAAMDSGHVYVGTKSAVVALGVDTGAEQWRTDVAGVTGPPVVADDRVLVAAADGSRLVALDTASGQQAWSSDAFSFAESAVGPIVADADGVAALAVADGRQVWRTSKPPVDQPMLEGPVVIDGNQVFVHTEHPAAVVALDAGSGAERWRQPMRASRVTPRVFATAGLVFLVEAGEADDRPAQVVALDAATGVQKWESTLSAAVIAPPAPLDDLVVFSTGTGIRALQLADGSERFAALEDKEYPNISSCGETACVLYNSLQLIDAQGQVVQEITPPNVAVLPPSTFLNVIVVLDADGTVYRYR